MAIGASVRNNNCAINRRIDQRLPVVQNDGLSQVCDLSIGPERCVACKSSGLDMQVSLLKLVLLGLGEVSLQVEHGGVKRSCYFFM